MLWVKRFRSMEHYAGSRAHPNSNASVLTNGGTVVPGASRGGNWSGDARGSASGRVVLPSCSAIVHQERKSRRGKPI
jgi:hypothetical protein